METIFKTWTQTLDPDPKKLGSRKTWTLENLDQEKLGPRKTWILKNLDPKNLDPEEHGINIRLKNISDFRELCFIKTMRNVINFLKVRVLTDISTKFFKLKIVLVITQL